MRRAVGAARGDVGTGGRAVTGVGLLFISAALWTYMRDDPSWADARTWLFLIGSVFVLVGELG